MQLKCLVVDDEPLSQDIIIEFVEASPELALAGVCDNALDAGKKLTEEKIDVLFLDINMPKLSGIGLVKSLKEPPLFIFVTAYPGFAVEGFEVNAVDYLLKPVSFERFRASVNRIMERISVKNEIIDSAGHIMLRADKKNYRVDFDNILFLEAQGDYVKFVTSKESLMVHGKMKDFVAQLPDEKFERIHKSYVISLSKVIYLEGNQVKIGDCKIPVSINYRERLIQKLS